MSLFSRYSLPISIIGLTCQIAGVTSVAWSLSQQVFFLFWVSLLGFGALGAKQSMFVAMQIVAFVGVVLWFFATVPLWALYGLMSIALLFALFYIYKQKTYQHDRYYVLGILWLFLLALGFATNPLGQPFLFHIYLALWWMTIALYSFLEVVFLQIRIAWIFLLLNIVFVINPLLWLLG